MNMFVSCVRFVFFLFSFVSVVGLSFCSPLTFCGQCAEGKLMRGVWWRSSGPPTYADCVSASWVTESGWWSTATRCRTTWSVGSASLECRQSEPLGPQIPAPQRFPPHTQPVDTNTRSSRHINNINLYTSSLWRHFLWRVMGEMQKSGCYYTAGSLRDTFTHTPAAGNCCQSVCYFHLKLWEWNCHHNLIGSLCVSVFAGMCSCVDMQVVAFLQVQVEVRV